MGPVRRRQDRQGDAHSSTLNELNQHDRGSSLTSIPMTPASQNFSNTVPKQVVDIVDMASSVDNLSKSYRRQLELDTLSTSELKPVTSPTQIFSNIEYRRCSCVKENRTLGLTLMQCQLNVYDQLNLKLAEENYS